LQTRQRDFYSIPSVSAKRTRRFAVRERAIVRDVFEQDRFLRVAVGQRIGDEQFTDGEHDAFGGIFGEIDEIFVADAVIVQKRRGQAERMILHGERRAFAGRRVDNDGLRIQRLDFGELGGEIFVARLKHFVGENLDARFFELFVHGVA